jgi:Ca2+-transporting ATPase
MRRQPRAADESILGRGLWQHAVAVGGLIAGVTIAVQAASRAAGWPWRTTTFSTIALLQLGHALAVRSERTSLFTQGLRSNRPLTAAVGLSVLLQAAVVYVPPLHAAFDTTGLRPGQLAVVLLASTAAFAAVELEKRWRRRRPEGVNPPRHPEGISPPGGNRPRPPGRPPGGPRHG